MIKRLRPNTTSEANTASKVGSQETGSGVSEQVVKKPTIETSTALVNTGTSVTADKSATVTTNVHESGASAAVSQQPSKGPSVDTNETVAEHSQQQRQQQ
uniref:Uncharacterized protein n=1 Tax=Lygus hesperus TaxID=30085 RepID=A0A0A9ZC42_LYGHE